METSAIMSNDISLIVSMELDKVGFYPQSCLIIILINLSTNLDQVVLVVKLVRTMLVFLPMLTMLLYYVLVGRA